ncbi:hypothetical protein EPN44_06445 [bacterium]|nr:MAG: hypothetical protein EPN44_06445 [bacterium]
MAGIGSTSGSTNGLPPVQFSGLVSGIDWQGILQKLTQVAQIPGVQIQGQIANLTGQNTAYTTLLSDFQTLQGSLAGLATSSNFFAQSATSSQTSILTAQQTSGQTAAPGTTTIQSVQLATSTTATSGSALGTSFSAYYNTAPLSQQPTGVTANNGTSAQGLPNAQGSVTINGVSVSYDVTTQSMATIVTNLTNALHAAGDTNFSLTYNAGSDSFTMTDTKQITLGSPSDQGNILQVMELTNSPITGSGPYTLNGTKVGSLQQNTALNKTNFAAGPINAGTTFSINGVTITINPTSDSVANVLTKINQSNAGVVATYNQTTDTISLTSATPGPQSIVLGSPSDTSNFLSVVKLTPSTATMAAGKQAVVQVGGQFYYSNSNTVTNVISGVTLNLLAPTTTPFTVTVGSNAQPATAAMQSFVTAFNQVVDDINKDTVPANFSTGSAPGSTAQQTSNGGPLASNFGVSDLRDQLDQLVQQIVGSGAFQSLAAIGLTLDSASLGASSSSSSSSSSGSSGSSSGTPSSTFTGTTGKLAFDAGAFATALQQNPQAVNNLLNGLQGQLGIVQQIASFAQTVTGLPTSLPFISGQPLLPLPPAKGILQSYVDNNNTQISFLNQNLDVVNQSVQLQQKQLEYEFNQAESQIALLQSTGNAALSQLGVQLTASGH